MNTLQEKSLALSVVYLDYLCTHLEDLKNDLPYGCTEQRHIENAYKDVNRSYQNLFILQAKLGGTKK